MRISLDEVGKIMHESWTRTKRKQGFHHPKECFSDEAKKAIEIEDRSYGHFQPVGPFCSKCHLDLVTWDELPEKQKDINRHAFDDVLAEIKKRTVRPEVAQFAEEMEKQLRANEDKGGWKSCDRRFLLEELCKNYYRLEEMLIWFEGPGNTKRNTLVSDENMPEILRRCANIANFVMMIADNHGGLMEGATTNAGSKE
jgi:hypothetical protein